MSKSEDNGIIDPEVKEELESIPGENPLLTEYATNSGGESDSIGFADKWFPKQEQWQGKTIITADQAYALSMLRSITEYFEELEDLKPFVEELIENYEVYLTSIDGEGREQQEKILRAMFGDSGEMNNDANGLQILSNPPDSDNDD